MILHPRVCRRSFVRCSKHHVGAACPCQARAQGLLARHPNACLAMDFQFPCQVMEVFSQRRLSEVYLSSLGADEILSHAEKKPLGPCFGWTKASAS